MLGLIAYVLMDECGNKALAARLEDPESVRPARERMPPRQWSDRI